MDCDSYEYTIFATLAICVLTIFIISPLLLLILYRLKVASCSVDPEGGMLFAHLWKHFRESTKMEPMALVPQNVFCTVLQP